MRLTTESATPMKRNGKPVQMAAARDQSEVMAKRTTRRASGSLVTIELTRARQPKTPCKRRAITRVSAQTPSMITRETPIDAPCRPPCDTTGRRVARSCARVGEAHRRADLAVNVKGLLGGLGAAVGGLVGAHQSSSELIATHRNSSAG